MKTEWIAVESSNIKEVAMEDDNLLVKFKSGAVYSYKEVSLHMILELLEAESAGKFFNKYIKGHYEYKKIEPNV